MDIGVLFADAGISLPADHPVMVPGVPVSESVVNLALGVLAKAFTDGVDAGDALTLLTLTRNLERGHNLVTALRARVLALADEAGVGVVDGVCMVDVVAEERRVTKQAATTATIKAVSQAKHPRVLDALAASRINPASLDALVATLEHVRPHYEEADYQQVEDELIREAACPVAGEFARYCRSLRESLDHDLARAGKAKRAKRRAQSFASRGIVITPVEGGVFGADIRGHLPAEYLKDFLPAISKAAEGIARAQRHHTNMADDRKVRVLDALYTRVTGHTPPTSTTDEEPIMIDAGRVTETDPGSSVGETVVAFPERTRGVWDTTEHDLGTTKRLADPKLRELLALRDGGCVFPACTAPVEECAAHHIVPARLGGGTDMRNLVLVCNHHHTMVDHEPGSREYWTMTIDNTGLPAAIPPWRIDPTQAPIYHPRIHPPGTTPHTPPPGDPPPSGFTLATNWRTNPHYTGPPPF